jgi:predicted MPP superfamily phosphohydrolase
MRNSPFWWVLIGFMVLLDFYVFQALKVMTSSAGLRTKTIIFYSYWIISVLAIVVLCILPYLHLEQLFKMLRTTVFAIIAALFFAKLLASVFFLVDDVRRAIQWIAGKIFFSNTEGESLQQGEKISRSVFISWAGMIVGGGLFGSLIYGFGNKYKYQLKRLQLAFTNLPASFRGLKIIHISDIHSGSFTDKAAVKKGIAKIMAQQPDLILFTGDLINDRATEMDDYMDIFSHLKAPMGVYSTLGNHDYGDYYNWGSIDEKKANLERLKQIHDELGWRLLLDENVTLEKDNDQIALIGVQNISGKRGFRSYGNMQKAYTDCAACDFKILLSHDPSHWDAEIIKKYPDIDLMLSGHTHGMQFGVEIPGWKWSPVQYIYKQWAGLYETGTQKLYVNRGFGFIGYPGRVGILPEITLLELV